MARSQHGLPGDLPAKGLSEAAAGAGQRGHQAECHCLSLRVSAPPHRLWHLAGAGGTQPLGACTGGSSGHLPGRGIGAEGHLLQRCLQPAQGGSALAWPCEAVCSP